MPFDCRTFPKSVEYCDAGKDMTVPKSAARSLGRLRLFLGGMICLDVRGNGDASGLARGGIAFDALRGVSVGVGVVRWDDDGLLAGVRATFSVGFAVSRLGAQFLACSTEAGSGARRCGFACWVLARFETRPCPAADLSMARLSVDGNKESDMRCCANAGES